MKFIILKNKVTFFILQILIIFSSFLYSSNESIIDNQFKSNILLCFTPNKILKKREEEYPLHILYLGNLYEIFISSHFGGQLILKDWNVQNKYYVVISNQIELLLDNNSCIKGYKIHPDHIKNSKMYVMYLVIAVNEKNEMTYNWTIEEITIPERSLPDNTIIINCSPLDISFVSFDKKFDKIYPNITDRENSIIVLPQIVFNSQNLFNNQLKNKNSIINTTIGHKKITHSHYHT